MSRSKWRITSPMLFILLVIFAWHLGLKFSGPSFIAPTPVEAAEGLLEIWNKGLLFDYTGASLFRVGSGFLIAIIVGIPLGFAMAWWPIIRLTLNPLVQLLRPISPIAWIPLAILWFGLSEAAPIYLIVLACVFPIILTTISAIDSIKEIWLRTAQNLELPWQTLISKIILPATLPEILTGLRVALGVGWMVVVAAEMIVANPRTGGLGYLVNDAFSIRSLENLEEIRWALRPKKTNL
ncbi:MAG: ABC transporter permease [Proteobacteria bacterium]|nr:ABC transporter permease [Pseudomonadota bacterium]